VAVNSIVISFTTGVGCEQRPLILNDSKRMAGALHDVKHVCGQIRVAVGTVGVRQSLELDGWL
jgi:hypothetical protein